MTALVVPTGLGETKTPPPVPFRQMAWVIWRQHRSGLGAAAGVFAATALYVFLSGLQLHHAYAVAMSCRPVSSFSCGNLARSFNGTNRFLASGVLLEALAPLVGIFLGAPWLAREFETGTYRFTFTQGFVRWRWAVSKMAGLATLLLVVTGLMEVLFSWYYRPYFNVANGPHGLSELSPYLAGVFELRGPSYVAWALAAFAIGSFVGLLLRRVVPALTVSLAICAGLTALTVGIFRQRYLSPVVTTRFNLAPSAWILSEQWRTKAGRPISLQVLGRLLAKAVPQVAGKGGVPKAYGPYEYLVHHGFSQWTSYQPASRFSSFQWIEAGWLVALGLLLVGATVLLVRRRAT
jgi:hypothetical protein